MLILFLAGCSPSANKHAIQVSDAYLREVLPGKQVTVAYMTLHNTSSRTCNLIGASASFARQIEIHEHLHAESGMRMQHRNALAILPGEQVEMAPGGYHLMVMGVTSPLHKNQLYSLSLEFADCVPLPIDIQVKAVLD